MFLDHDSRLSVTASREELDALFPFGILLDASGKIVLAGRTIVKLVPCVEIGGNFRSCFEVLSPSIGISSEDLDAILGEIVVVHAKNAPKPFRLRGQCLKWSGGYLFALTLVLNDLDKLQELGLDFSDFSLSDPIFDLLLLVQSERRYGMELKKANEREKMALAKLAMASRLSALGEMSAGIAHEINNPLAIIQMACEQFLDAPEMPHDRAVSILRRSQNAAMRIGRIVTGLRTYARDGSLDDVAPSELGAIVTDTLVLCENRFRQRGIDLRVGAVPEGTTLECNAVQVSQILMNLLGNAMDSVASLQDAWVRMDFDVSADWVVVRVTDCGARLSPEVAQRVMQPFFTTKPVGQGTGLGLPISLGIAEAHGGRLYLDSNCENVSFVLELPRSQKQ